MWSRRSIVAAGIASAITVGATSAPANNSRTVAEYSGRLQAANFQRFTEEATKQAGRTRHVKLDVMLDPKEAGLAIQKSATNVTIALESNPGWKLVIEGTHSATSAGDIHFDRFFLKWRWRDQSDGTPVYVLADAKKFKFDKKTMRLQRVGI